jgi:uncharacterized protein
MNASNQTRAGVEMKSGLDLVKAFYAAAGSGNAEGMAEVLSPDVLWIEMESTPYAGKYRGAKEVFSSVFARLDVEWENYTFTPDRFHDAGNSVAAAGWYTAVYRKTGKALRCRALHVWDVRDNKIVGFEQFCDSLTMSCVLS